MDVSAGGAAPAASGTTTTTSAPQVSEGQSGSLKTNSSPVSSPHVSEKAPPSSSTPTPEVFEVKVNGRIVKMTRQEMHDRASMSFAAQQKFDEASKLKKQWEEKEQTYQKDPLKAFLDYANNLPPEQKRKALEDYYYKEFLEADTLTADQKRAREYEAKLKKYEEQEQTQKQQKEQEEQERLVSFHREELTKQIVDIFEKAQIPIKSKFSASRAAFYMRQNAQNGFNATPEMIARQVNNERRELFRGEVGVSSIEEVTDLLGEDFMTKLRRYDLERIRSRRGGMTQAATPNRGAGTGVVGERLSSSEVQQRLNDIKRGKL